MSKQEKLEQIQSYLCERFHLPREQVGEMMPKFMDTLSMHMGKLESAMASGDLLTLGKAGHTMKGALLNLGLDDSAEIAKEIELKGKAHAEDVNYNALIGDLRRNLEILIS